MLSSSNLNEFLNRKVVILKTHQTAYDAARAMCENQIGCVFISNLNGKISGIVTDRDLACNLIALNFDSDTRLSEIMTEGVLFVSEKDSLEDVVQIMEKNGVRRVPVIRELSSGHDRCIGLVVLDDLIASQAVSFDRVSKIVKSQIKRRQKARINATRSETRKEQTYEHFVNVIAEDLGIKKEQSEIVSHFLLGNLMKRLHYTGAVHLASQLPAMLRESLLDLPAGPDRSIQRETFISGTADRLGVSLEDAALKIREFWRVLRNLISVSELEHVLDQLPKDLRFLFEGKEEKLVSIERVDSKSTYAVK